MNIKCYIIHIEFSPFTGFTFFNQTPYSSMIQGESTSRFPGNRTHRLYARCSPSVCLRLANRMPGTWETFAQRPESGNGLSPCIADEQSSEAKR